MKKIYSALVLFTTLFYTGKSYGQANLVIQEPVGNDYSQDVAPTGATSYMKGCFLVTASELAGLTGSSLSSFGLAIEYGSSTSVNGNMTIYMQNTSDTYYNKSTNYSTALSGMTSVYNGNMTVPSSTGASTIALNLPSYFNYTGGGIYIAYSWSATSQLDNYGAYYYSNYNSNAFSYMGAYVSYSSNYLSSSYYRPSCFFGFINTATNEAAILSISAPGTAAEAIHVPQVITADIKNSSINALSNLSVSLHVTGSNFSDVQVIPNITAGSVETVTFLPFSPVAQGSNNIVVSLPYDQNLSNNSYAWTQSVTCNRMSYMPAGDWTNSGNLLSFGFSNVGIFADLFNFSDTTNLQALNMIVGNDYNVVGTSLYGVLLDQNGSILATTNTVNITSTQINTYVTFSFSAGQSLAANQNYYAGMAQTTSGTYPMAVLPVVGGHVGDLFYAFPINGGTPNLDNSYGYFAIDAIFAGPHISVTQASTVICTGESITLAASGGNTYTWSASIFDPIDTPHNGTITVSPSGNEQYVLTAIDAAGCMGSTTAPVAVKTCVGLAVNSPLDALELYPNPAVNNKTTIAGLSGKVTISVYNMLGALVSRQSTSDEKATIDLSGQAQGNYLVRITDSENHSKTLKFVNQD